jgi:hypothetical protein
MDAKSLTAQQRGAIRRQVLRHRECLGKVVVRMDALEWPAEDPVRAAAVATRDAADGMLSALEAAEPPAPFLSHYRSDDRAPYVPGPTTSAPWVGKRKARKRR